MGNVLEANQQYAVCSATPWKRSTASCLGLGRSVHDKEELLKMLEAVDTAAIISRPFTAKDGALFEVEISTNGPVIGGQKFIFCLCRDITERKKAEEALAKEKRHLSLLNQAAVEMSHCLTTLEVRRAGIRLACKTTGATAGVICLLPSAVRGRALGSKGLSREDRRQLLEFVRTSAAVERVLKEQVPVLLPRAEFPDGVASRETAFAGVLLAPVLSRGKAIGILCLATETGQGELSASACALAAGIGALIGVAWENARLYEDTRYLAERDPVTRLLNHRGITASWIRSWPGASDRAAALPWSSWTWTTSSSSTTPTAT